MLKVNDGVEAVEIRLIFKDKRKKQTFLVKQPNIDYSITNDIQPIYSMFGEGGPTEYVVNGPSLVEFNVRGRVAYPKPLRGRRQSTGQTRRSVNASKRPISERRSERQ